MGGNSDAGDSAFAANGLGAAALGGDSAMGGASTDGGSSADGNGAHVLHSQRRSLTPMKRVESRVPVNDVQEQPLLQQARKILDDQRNKWVLRLLGAGCCAEAWGGAKRAEASRVVGWVAQCSGARAWQRPSAAGQAHLTASPAVAPPSRYKESTEGFGWYDWLGFFLPCFVWLRTYDWRNWLLVRSGAGGAACQPRPFFASGCGCPRAVLAMHQNVCSRHAPHVRLPVLQSDIAAGLSVGAMVIPQGMSYAKLAGLPQGKGCAGLALLGTWRVLGRQCARAGCPFACANPQPALLCKPHFSNSHTPACRRVWPVRSVRSMHRVRAAGVVAPAGGGPCGSHLHHACQRPVQHLPGRGGESSWGAVAAGTQGCSPRNAKVSGWPTNGWWL